MSKEEPRKTKRYRNYENCTKAIFPGAGEYDIPVIKPESYQSCDWIGINFAKSCTKREGKGVHFFVDDYQFIRLWTAIDCYIPMLLSYESVLTPDFSLYRDFPLALQIYNHYRKHWIGAYMQLHGIHVIPTIGWSDERSYEWCFDGEPTRSVVAVSSIGCNGNTKSRELFLKGYTEMMKRLMPQTILFYGEVPSGCEGNIIRIKAFQDKWKKGK